MALIKSNLENTLKKDFRELFKNQLSSMKEVDSPQDVINNLADKMAQIVANSVDKYLKTADVVVGPKNILVTPTTGSAVVTLLTPAKLS